MSSHNGESVVITGAGLVLPGADTLPELSAAAREGVSAIRPVGRSTAGGEFAAGLVAGDQLAVLPARLRKRMDRFCALSMIAARRALNEAQLIGEDGTELRPGIDPERAGSYLANMFGGWDITEASMRQLCRVGYTGVSPYIASAWFPTASQGQLSINWGLRGFSKTVVGDTASAALAVGYAARAIRAGRADIMLAGGAEAPVTPYIQTFCSTSGRTSGTGYRPFAPDADGFQVGEGAVVFTLESLRSARARGVPALAEIAGFAAGHARETDVFGDAGTAALARVAGAALAEADTAPADLTYVGLDAQARPDADATELSALRRVLGATLDRTELRTVKPVTGHLLGAAPAVELAGAVDAVRRPAGPAAALVNARGADGTLACCALRAA